MKRIAIFFIFCLFSLTVMPLFASATEASEQVGSEYQMISEELEAFKAAIPPEVAELLPDGFFSSDIGEMAEGVREVSGLQSVLSVVARLTGLVIGESLSLLAGICGILLLSAVFRAFAITKGGEGRALGFCSGLAVTLLILSSQARRFSSLSVFFSTVGNLAVALLPLMGTLYAMGGNVTAAVVNSSFLSAFLSVTETVLSKTVLPVAGICLVFSLLDALCDASRLRPLAALIKRSYTLGFSFLMLLLSAVLGMQSILGKAGDTLALRTARFAAGSFLPVVGGSISETLRTVASSVEYLRGVVGVGGVAVLFFAFLPTFLSVALTRIAFLLSGSVAKMLDCDREERLLGELGSVYGYFLAVIAVLFVTLTFSLTLFARCAAAG